MKLKRYAALILGVILTLSLFACARPLTSLSLGRDGAAPETQNSQKNTVTAPDTDAAVGTADTEDDPGTTRGETSQTEDGEPSVTEDGEPSQTEDGEPSQTEDGEPSQTSEVIDERGTYTTKEDVALYIRTYGRLPDNFITKKEAESLGWSGGSLEPYAPGKCIGGSRFGNYEGLLPKKTGRTYTECDIDTLGAKSRGAKRIVFSNDGLIYYTDDHYESFTLLWGEP